MAELLPTTTAAVTGAPHFDRRLAVDGLRGVASLLVILFHCDTPGFKNGFIGVDVFYLISGFVITAVLLREVASSGTLNFARFYARRARRLLPVSLVVLVGTCILQVSTLPPLKVIRDRATFVAASIYMCNWSLIQKSADYFSTQDRIAVQHYWSLSVEEQFYIIWPISLYLLASVPRKVWMPTIISVISLSLYWTRYANETVSYMATQGRIYQLLFGSVLAFAHDLYQQHQHQHHTTKREWEQEREHTNNPNNNNSELPNLLANLSVGLLILTGSSFFGDSSPFILGFISAVLTFVFLVSSELASTSWSTVILTSKAMQLLGKYSYSMYLLHWPIIVLGDAWGVLPTDLWMKTIAVFAMTLSLSWFTWTLIEQPTSRIPISTRKSQLTFAIGGFVAALVCAGLLYALMQVPAEVEDIYNQLDRPYESHGGNTNINPYGTKAPDLGLASTTAAAIAPTFAPTFAPTEVPGISIVATMEPTLAPVEPRCLVSDNCNGEISQQWPTPGPKNIILAGDSFSMMFFHAINSVAERRGYTLGYVGQASCTWLCSIHMHEVQHHRCCNVRPIIIEKVQSVKPDILLLAANTITLDTVLQIDDKSKQITYLSDDWKKEVELGSYSFLNYIKQFAKRVIVIEPLLALTQYTPPCIEQGRYSDCTQQCIETDGMKEVRRIFRLTAGQAGVETIDISSYVCSPDGTVPVKVNGMLTYREQYHLTNEYMATFAPRFEEKMFPDG